MRFHWQWRTSIYHNTSFRGVSYSHLDKYNATYCVAVVCLICNMHARMKVQVLKHNMPTTLLSTLLCTTTQCNLYDLCAMTVARVQFRRHEMQFESMHWVENNNKKNAVEVRQVTENGFSMLHVHSSGHWPSRNYYSKEICYGFCCCRFVDVQCALCLLCWTFMINLYFK